MHRKQNPFLIYWKSRILPQAKLLHYRPMPDSVQAALPKLPLTLGLSLLIIGLEIFKQISPLGLALFERSAFRAGAMSWEPIFLSGLFHEGAGHFFANLFAVWICVAALELALGTLVAAAIFASGALLSNPLTVLVLKPLLEWFAPGQVANLLANYDYGASNGIYAVVGGLAFLLKRPGQLIWPFIFNGLFYAFATSSWLAMQHEIGLFTGFFLIQAFLMKRERPAIA